MDPDEDLSKHCQCDSRGSVSEICDINSQCKCKKVYDGQRCSEFTGALLITGGLNGSGRQRHTEMFDPSDSALSCSLPDMNDERQNHAGVGSLVCGGHGSSSGSCETFDVKTGQWRRSHNLQEKRRSLIMWHTPADKIILMGGGFWSGTTRTETLQNNGTSVESFKLQYST